MSKINDLTGKRFGRLVVLQINRSENRTIWWDCICDCGNTAIVRRCSLASGKGHAGTRSCGCLQKEWQYGKFTKLSKKHGWSGTSEYNAWISMRQRCLNPDNHAWKDYGKRGIRICSRWQLFKNFLADMGPRPSPKHSIERRENNGDYCPENCYWGTRKQQMRNRRNTLKVKWRGKERILKELCEELGIEYQTVYWRLQQGWTLELALEKHRKQRFVADNPKQTMIIFHGRTQSLAAWARETGISATNISGRLRAGWSAERTLTTPTRKGNYRRAITTPRIAQDASGRQNRDN